MNSKITESTLERIKTAHERRMQRIIRNEQEGRDWCRGLKFKLVGILNMFDIIPGFVDPIFICLQDEPENPNIMNKPFYFQVGNDEKDTLTFFEKLDNYGKVKQNVLKLKDSNTYAGTQFDIHSEPLYAFQYSETDIMFGNYSEMKEFLKQYETEDDILRKEIQDFLDLESKNIWPRVKRELVKNFPKDSEDEINMKVKTLKNNDFEGPLELYIQKFHDIVLKVGIRVKGENKKSYYITEEGHYLDKVLEN